MLISSIIASLFNEKLAIVKRAELLFKVSRDDPYLDSSNDTTLNESLSRGKLYSESDKLAWFANLTELRVSFRSKMALIFCCFGCLVSSRQKRLRQILEIADAR